MNPELDSLSEAEVSDALLDQLRDDIQSDPDNLCYRIEAICRQTDRLCKYGDPTAAEALYRKALSSCEIAPIRIGAAIGLKIYRGLAELLETQDRREEACLNYLTALNFAGDANSDNIDTVSVAEIHKRLGILLSSSDELTAAAKHYRQGIARLAQAASGDAGGNPRTVELTAELEESLADLQLLFGDDSAALGGFSRALQCRRQLLDTAAQNDPVEICRLFEKLGRTFKLLDENDTSQACMQRSQKIHSSSNSL